LGISPVGFSRSLQGNPFHNSKLALRVTAEDEQKTLACKGGFGGDQE
jgi:hypothetical protein